MPDHISSSLHVRADFTATRDSRRVPVFTVPEKLFYVCSIFTSQVLDFDSNVLKVGLVCVREFTLGSLF